MKNTAIFFFAVILTTASSSAQCPQLIWSDEFEGTALDLTKWEAQTGDGCDINLCGWGNNELEYYQAANATLSGGTLKITAKREQAGGRNYTSARLRTKNKADFTYGRFEARMKLPAGQGIWPAFWMLPTDETYGGWPQSGEIDIMELIGSQPDVAHGTIHFGNAWPNNRSTGGSYRLHNGRFSDGFHEFAIEWAPDEIRWYVDGYLFSRKTRADVSPFRWPFDQDFHLLFNLAVGGNWPGNPNSSTVFPQAMEVDYVRVYDGVRPAITGKRTVANRAQGEAYAVQNAAADAVFNWNVPEGAAIASGQGTDRISVDWGDAGGDLSVEVVSSCGTDRLTLDVLVEAAFGYDFSFENFDDPGKLTFDFATGVFKEDVANPAPQGVNTSALVGEYVRNGAEQYDVLIYRTGAVPNASEYLDGRRKFYVDVLTNSPVGTLLLLQLEDNRQATGANYPTGRHSRFQAFTSVQNQWERLEFSFLDRPDGSVSSASVNQLIFLFASNSRTGHTYHWDNFDSYLKGGGPATATPSAPVVEETSFILYPNPARQHLFIERKDDLKWKGIRILDRQGRALRTMQTAGAEAVVKIDVADLPAGHYFLQVESLSGEKYALKFVKE